MEAGAHPENQGGGCLVREKKDYVGYVTALRKSSIFEREMWAACAAMIWARLIEGQSLFSLGLDENVNNSVFICHNRLSFSKWQLTALLRRK